LRIFPQQEEIIGRVPPLGGKSTGMTRGKKRERHMVEKKKD